MLSIEIFGANSSRSAVVPAPRMLVQPGAVLVDPEISLQGLINRIVDRDQEAFEILFGKFRNYVFGLARGMLRSESEAEEVLQDVFLGLWLRPPSTRHGVPSLLAWLAVTTKKQCWLRLRRSQHEIQSDRSQRQLEYLEPVVDRIAEMESREKLEKELPFTPKKHLEVLRLAYYDDMGATQIATLLGLPVITVRKRLDAATSRLRRHFGCKHNLINRRLPQLETEGGKEAIGVVVRQVTRIPDDGFQTRQDHRQRPLPLHWRPAPADS